MAGLFSYPCQADDFDTVSSSFKKFSRDWVTRLQSSYLYTQDSPGIVKKNGQYVASFDHLDENSVKTSVKKADGPGRIYTGLLQYNEYLFQSTGKTRDLAGAGRFTAKSMKQMTEIFLYKDGAWMR